MGSWASSTLRSSFYIVTTLFLVVVTSVSINGIDLNSPQIALAQQQQQSLADLSSVNPQQVIGRTYLLISIT